MFYELFHKNLSPTLRKSKEKQIRKQFQHTEKSSLKQRHILCYDITENSLFY